MRFASLALLFIAAALLIGCATPSGAPGSAAVDRRDEEPLDPEIKRRFETGFLALRQERYADAERAFGALVRTHPELSGPYANLGIVFWRTNRPREAVVELKRAVALRPRADYYNQLGIVYRHQGQFEDARASYRKALDIDPRYAPAHLNIGILYDLYLGEGGKALDHYQRFQELQPAKDEEVAKWIIELQRREQRAETRGGRDSS